jgi:hypothetical protein
MTFEGRAKVADQDCSELAIVSKTSTYHAMRLANKVGG